MTSGIINSTPATAGDDNVKETPRFNIWSILLPTLFFVVAVALLFIASGGASAEHSADISVEDHGDGDRVIAWNATDIDIDINVTNLGEDSIEYVEITVPTNVVITGWTTTNGNSTYWQDAPDVDGVPTYEQGGNTFETSPTLLLISRGDNNISAGKWEMFTITVRTNEAALERGIFPITVETTDNKTATNSTDVQIAIIGTEEYLDICVELTDFKGEAMEINSAYVLLPNSSSLADKKLNTTFENFPDNINASDIIVQASQVEGGLALWLDGVDFNSNLTNNVTYQINASDDHDDHFIYVEAEDGTGIKLKVDDYVLGDNSRVLLMDGSMKIFNTLSFTSESAFFSQMIDANHNVFPRIIGFKGPTNILSKAYSVNDTTINSTFWVIETIPGNGKYQSSHPGIDLNLAAWAGLNDGDVIRIEIDLNGDGGFVIAYIVIDSTKPTVDDYFIDDPVGPFLQLLHPYIWYNESANILWYQNAMVENSDGNLTETIVVNITASDEHLWTVYGSLAFGETPAVSGSNGQYNLTYKIDNVGETATQIKVTIIDLAGNEAELIINCALDNDPPEVPEIIQIDTVSGYVYSTEEIWNLGVDTLVKVLYYRNDVPGMDEDFSIIINNVQDAPGGSGFFSVVGSYAFNGSARDSVPSNGLALIYKITFSSYGDDITIMAVDHVGNYANVTLYVEQDNDAPIGPTVFNVEEDSKYIYYDGDILYYRNTQTSSETLTFVISTEDAGSGLAIIETTNEAFGEWGSVSSPGLDGYFRITFVLSPGESVVGNMITFRVTDNLGNTATLSFLTALDNVEPTSVVLEVFETDDNVHFSNGVLYYSNDQPMNAMVYINISGEDAGSGLQFASIPVMFNGSYPDLNTYDSPYDDIGGLFNLAYSIEMGEEGQSEINITILDNVGNVYYYNIICFLDNAAPTTTDDAPTQWMNGAVDITLDEVDDGAGIKNTFYSLDGSTPTAGSQQYYDATGIQITAQGTWVLQYFSVDMVNNHQMPPAPRNVKIDKTLPTMDITWTPGDVNSDTKEILTIFVVGSDEGGSGLSDFAARINWTIDSSGRGIGNYSGWIHMTQGAASGQWYYEIDVDWSMYEDLKVIWYISLADSAGNSISKKITEHIDFVEEPNQAPVIELLTPVGDELWTGMKYIRWYAEDPEGDPIVFDIYVSWDEGVNFHIIEEGIPGGNRSYLWDSDTMTSSFGEKVYMIKVVAREVGINGLASSAVSGAFEIFAPNESDDEPPLVELIYPTGGSVVYGPIYIRWTASDPDGDDISISIYLVRILGNGTVIRTVIADGLTGDVNYWRFDPSGIVAQNDYRLEIVARQDGGLPWKVIHMSEEFSIYQPTAFDNHPPVVNLITPGGGEVYYSGEDTIIISWSASDEDAGDSDLLEFSIYYSTDGGVTFMPLATNIKGLTEYEWDLKKSQAAGKYLIKITCTDKHSLYYSAEEIAVGEFSIEPYRGDDRDGDGMTNSWELLYSLDPDNAADAETDADSDGLTNLKEFQLQTNPQKSDTDSDGLDDFWEYIYDFDPNDPITAGQDFDSDGFTNFQEYVNGTDPKDASSKPVVLKDGQTDEMDAGWLTITLLLLVVTVMLLSVLYITKPDPWDEDELEREIEEWVQKIRKEHPLVRDVPLKTKVTKKKIKPIRKRKKPKKEKEVLPSFPKKDGKKLIGDRLAAKKEGEDDDDDKPKAAAVEADDEDVLADVYIAKGAMEKMVKHCYQYADDRKEVMGFMLGDRYTHDGGEYTVVKDIVTTDLDSSEVSVKFNRDGFEDLFKEMDKLPKDYIIVGWYHSHPGHTVFMSSTDVRTQESMFNQPFHVALVIDPINIQMKAFGCKSGRSYEKAFAVFKNGLFNSH